MICAELIALFNDIADPSLSSGWDNPGLTVGDENMAVKRILVALDATDEVIDEAVELDVDLILTHHPLIFKGIKKVNNSDFTGRRILRLIKNDISCFAMHTNFDIACMGGEASDRIGLKNSRILQEVSENEGFGRIGDLPQSMSVSELGDLVKERFDIEYVKVFGDLDTVVSTAAVMPGSGASAIDDAIEKGADVLITGDIDHHEGIDSVEKNLIIIDAGHFGLEKIFIDYMKDYIERNTEGLEVYTDIKEKGFTII